MVVMFIIKHRTRTALAYYSNLGISMMVHSKGCIEPTENVSIDNINYAGLYYLNQM